MLCRAIWDNRCVHHAVTPTHAAAQTNDPGYVTLGETRLMFRTEMQPTAWVPELLPPALREEVQIQIQITASMKLLPAAVAEEGTQTSQAVPDSKSFAE